MKYLKIEIEDNTFTRLAEQAHLKNTTLTEHVSNILSNHKSPEDEKQLKLDMGEPYAPKEQVTQDPNTRAKVNEKPKDLTKPPFTSEKKVSQGVPTKLKKTTNQWVDPEVANKPNSWLF